jgi:magnesium transporter
MMRAMLYQPASGKLLTGGKELVGAWHDDLEAIIWVDFSGHGEDEEKQLMRQAFGLHPLAIQDAQRDRHPPKVEEFGDHFFLLLKGLDAKSTSIEFATIQLAMFAGKRFFVTRHKEVSRSIDGLWSDEEREHQHVSQSPSALAIALCLRMVGRYLPILLDVEKRLEEMEELMLGTPGDELLAELMSYKSNLKKLRRIFAYHEQVFSKLRRSPPAIFPPGEIEHALNDVYEHLERVNSLATLYYDLTSDLMDGYISVASHRLNNIMKVLTIVASIFIPLTFVAGIYGMNFENMPELKSPIGYFIVLAVMAIIAAILLVIFRKLKWL